jgi:hypothetical protein
MNRLQLLAYTFFASTLFAGCPATDEALPDGGSATVDSTNSGGDSLVASEGRNGFILIHCDPQEILHLHNNYQVDPHDYDGDKKVDAADFFGALMDLVDLADSHGHRLTLQFSPPYMDYIGTSTCDDLLGVGRKYPAAAGPNATHCKDLVLAWKNNGHEMSIHHHGPNHDAAKFDGHTNREIYATKGKRICSTAGGSAACSCPDDKCYWCGPPNSSFFCTEATNPKGYVGADSEWKGTIEGEGSLMSKADGLFGAGTVRSICMNHTDEEADFPADDDIIYATQGGAHFNDFIPRCVGYEPKTPFRSVAKLAWFYSHDVISNAWHFQELKTEVTTWQAGPQAKVMGVVFHVGDFIRTERAEKSESYLLHRDFFKYLNDPDADGDASDAITIVTLTGLLQASGKVSAPDPCAQTCYALDAKASAAEYTVEMTPPPSCL